jgi:GNAT superfamily N-acetyltransferase
VYDIVPYRPEHKRQVAVLQRHLWRGDEALNTAYLEWKYERNPYLPAPLICLALHDGNVVGMRGMFGSCWEVGPGAERFIVPCGDDLVIAPVHRRRGLFGQIMNATVAELIARGHAVTFSLSAGPVAMAGSLARGWRSVGSVREVSRIARPTSLPWRLPIRMPAWSAVRRLGAALSYVWKEPFRRLDQIAPRSPSGSAIWSAREPRPEAMADLVQRLGHDGRVRHVRDARYLAWRFVNPLHEYRFLLAGEDRLEGYLVLQAYRLVGRGRVNVVDWEATSPAVRRALLRAAIDWGRFGEMSTWTMSLPEEAGTLLRENGFLPVTRHRLAPQGPAVLVRSPTSSPGEPGPALGGRPLLDAATWDMRMLYSMAG